MAESVLRANSLRLRFERGQPEPTDAEIFAFMKGKMGLKSNNLLSMYKEKPEQSVIIKFRTEDDLKETLLRLPGSMEFAYNKYQSTTVQVSAASAIVRYVRIFNLPPEVDDRDIWTVLSRYGKIQRTIREKYAESTGFPIWNSVRGVYIELKEGCELPATILVRNQRARVYYDGLVNKCFQCGSASHLKAECPNRSSVNDRLKRDQNDVRNHGTYSGALMGNWTKSNASGEIAEQGTMVNLNQLFSKPRTDDSMCGSNNADDGAEAEGRAVEETIAADGASSMDVIVEAENIAKDTNTKTMERGEVAVAVDDQSTVDDVVVSTSEASSPEKSSSSAVGEISSVDGNRQAIADVTNTEQMNATRNAGEDWIKGTKRGRKLTKGKRGEQSSSNTSAESSEREEGTHEIPKTNILSQQQTVKTRSRSKQPKLSQKNGEK